jgi:uncharacterized repeat protein (TIGR03803 family)
MFFRVRCCFARLRSRRFARSAAIRYRLFSPVIFLAFASLCEGCSGGASPITPPSRAESTSQLPSSLRSLSEAAAGPLDAGEPAALPLFETLYRFSGRGDGSVPLAGLIVVNNVLYGTTSAGGYAGCGGVYSLTPSADGNTFTESTLHEFRGGTGGCGPSGGLVNSGSNLYGVTVGGGSGGNGTVYEVPLAGGSGSILYSFKGGTDGGVPFCTLTTDGTYLYGTTLAGGAISQSQPVGYGVLFRLSLSHPTETVLHAFTPSQGAPDVYESYGGVVESGNALYGTGEFGGAHGAGGAFRYQLPSGPESLLYSFAAAGKSDAGQPGAAPIVIGSRLYGTSETGGTGAGDGTVFSLPLGGGSDSLLYSFQGGKDGNLPQSPVTLAGVTLFGTTEGGGSEKLGTLYGVPLAGGNAAILHNFVGGTQGRFPFGALLPIGSFLYGTTYGGGTSDYGTVFRMHLPKS